MIMKTSCLLLKLKSFSQFSKPNCKFLIPFYYKHPIPSFKLFSSRTTSSLDKTYIVNALSVSIDTKSLLLGTQVHGCVIKSGLTNDVFCRNKIVQMYCMCRVWVNGLKVFDEMPERNLFSWSLVISGAVYNEEFEMGLQVFIESLRDGLVPNEFVLGSVLKACIEMGEYRMGLCAHCLSEKIGVVKTPFVGSSLVNMHSKLGCVEDAEKVFKCVEFVDIACLNAMIGAYADCGCGEEALKVVSSMQAQGVVLDEYTFINSLKGCSQMDVLDYGRQVHGLIICSEVDPTTPLMNALIDMYLKVGSKGYAIKVFDRVRRKDIISWNTMFGGFDEEDAGGVTSLFHRFMLTGLKPNRITFTVLLGQCGRLNNLNLGLQFACLAMQIGYIDESKVLCSLIKMFSQCGAISLARLAFESGPLKSIDVWNEIISGYNLNYCYSEAQQMYCNILESGIKPDRSTFSGALEVCCALGSKSMARKIHGLVFKHGLYSNSSVCNSLVKLYGSLGELDDSFRCLHGLQKCDLACWTTFISTLVHRGNHNEAIRSLKFLMESGEKPDEFILASMFNSFAIMSDYIQTKSMHSLATKTGYHMHRFIISATIDAYSKCGDIRSARTAFDQSSSFKDVVVYNSMIMSYAYHGLLMEGLEIFEQMKLEKLCPSQATFVAVISACNHRGFLDLGCALFQSMISDFGIKPSLDIYGCLVDMLSRNGCLEKAKCLIEAMPCTPGRSIWRSLMNGCRIYGNRELGEWAFKKLFQLAPEDDAGYVLLSKVYSESGSWENVAKLQQYMMERHLSKQPGHSCIQIE